MRLLTKTCKLTDFPFGSLISNTLLKTDFLLTFSKHLNYNIKYLYVVNQSNNMLLALTYVVEKKFLGIPISIIPQLLYYQPIEIFTPTKKYPNENQLQNLEIFKSMAGYFTKYYLKVQKNLSPEIDDIRGFVWSGMQALPLYTYRFDLTNYSSDNFFKKTKAVLRKAQALNYSFDQKSDVNSLLTLIKGTKERQEWHFNFSDNTLENVLVDLINLNYVKQFNIRNSQGQVVSSMVCIMDEKNKIAYAWLASTNISELSSGVSTLIFHSICTYLVNNYQIFDLQGANTDTIARFKASHATQLKVFYRIKV